jgi:hypothetical protein
VAENKGNRCRKKDLITSDKVKNLCPSVCKTKCETSSPTNTLPSIIPTSTPQSDSPTTLSPTKSPTNLPSKAPTDAPSKAPSNAPTNSPTDSPSPPPPPPPVYPCGCCGNRINYLRYDLGFAEEAACSKTGGIEFPSNDACGKCDPTRCIDNEDEDDEDKDNISQPNQPQNNDNNNKCGAAVNSSDNSNQKCKDDLWSPTGDSTMHCFAYGGSGDPCHLSNNNDSNNGLDKNPLKCKGDTFYLWDEPDTQGKTYAWAGEAWYDY